jgi:hypothetical protein
MMRVLLAFQLLFACGFPACDSPHRRPPVDADADADGPDADFPDDLDGSTRRISTSPTAGPRGRTASLPRRMG